MDVDATLPGRRPQLCINIVYLNTMGFAGADPIAVFSFIMSILSLIFNAGLGISEARAMAGGDSSYV